jgi:hypothetical protein
MSSLPVNVAVFFGKVDKRPVLGAYFGSGSPLGSNCGPFETKAGAVEDANQAAAASLEIDRQSG